MLLGKMPVLLSLHGTFPDTQILKAGGSSFFDPPFSLLAALLHRDVPDPLNDRDH